MSKEITYRPVYITSSGQLTLYAGTSVMAPETSVSTIGATTFHTLIGYLVVNPPTKEHSA